MGTYGSSICIVINLPNLLNQVMFEFYFRVALDAEKSQKIVIDSSKISLCTSVTNDKKNKESRVRKKDDYFII